MSWDDPDLEKNFADALNKFKWGEVTELCEQTIARIKSESSPIDAKLAKDLLYRLRRKRQFGSMVQMAEAMLRSGLNTLPVRRGYAQALIDQGMYMPAELVLRSVVSEAADNSLDKREALGGLGRIYKQLYVNNKDPNSAANRENLEQALKNYLPVYRPEMPDSWWHGINGVALLARAKRDGFPIPGMREPEDLAGEILAAIKDKEDNSNDPLPTWELATRVEAYVAVGKAEEAARAARRYVDSSGIDAFEVYSTLRQFEEVWQLKDNEPPGNLLLPVLRTAHLERSGAMSKGDPKDLKAEADALADNMKNLEAIFGPDKAQTYKWYKLGLDQCNSVARIERRNGQGHGTGWLVRAEDFFPGEQGVYLLTNDHVISNVANQLAIAPQDCQVNFQAMEEVLEAEDQVRWGSSYTKLDASFLKLKGTPKAPPLVLHKSAVMMKEPKPRMYIIGHPQGRDLEIAMQDNELVAVNDTLVHYRTPTEPGNSGSPVFEADAWEVVALHHKGKEKMKRIDGQEGFYQANEGISIKKLQSETAKPTNT
ncbi:MAG TPA: serine protease [Pyrinomonadaceae bacterium]|nr:serine protease [Pyrinomonadaceae bacterium]